jgi:hypothetical protein
MQEYLGSCLCSGVHYKITNQLGPIVYCHCQRCQKASGSASVHSVEIQRSDFAITQGNDLVQCYENPSQVNRFFCKRCGSQLFSQREATPDSMRVRLGTLDTKIDKKVAFHIFVDSKPLWDDILDDAPQYPARPGD